MEHKNTVKRDRLYVGELVVPYDYQLNDNGKVVVYIYDTCRNILFSLDDDMATDVLYESPQYPVVNITNPTRYIDRRIVVKDAICLDELLKYFGYPEELTEEDIKQIRQTFFTGDFCLNNAKLFGYQEINAEDMTFYDENKQIITDPVLLEEKRATYRKLQEMGHRMVKHIGNGALSSDYFNILDKKADNSIYDFVDGYVEHIDSFAPVKKEGHGRVLKKH